MVGLFETLIRVYKETDFPPKKKKGTIYHYTSPDGLIGILTEKQFYASDLFYLNDAAEGVYALELLEEICETEYPENEWLREGIKKEIEKLSEKDFYSYTVSFSMGEDILGMWKYFTKGNTCEGYNIAFDIERLAETFKIQIDNEKNGKPQQDDSNYLKPIHGAVNYNLDQQKDVIRKILYAFVENTKNYDDEMSFLPNPLAYFIVRKVFYLGMFYKSPEYRDEKEYRFLFCPPIVEKKEDLQKKGIPCKEEYKQKNGIVIPFQKCKFSADSVVSVMCAPTVKYDRKEAGIKRILSSEYKGICNEVHRSKLKLRY